MKRRVWAVFTVLLTLMLLLVCGMASVNHWSSAAHAASPTQPTHPLLGIEIPVGALLKNLPNGVTDYIRRVWPELLPEVPATNPPLGVDLPAGASPADLPAGIREYLRPTPIARMHPVRQHASSQAQDHQPTATVIK